jgi:hypothetical protein
VKRSKRCPAQPIHRLRVHSMRLPPASLSYCACPGVSIRLRPNLQSTTFHR